MRRSSSAKPTSGIMISTRGSPPRGRTAQAAAHDRRAPASRRSRGTAGPGGSRACRASGSARAAGWTRLEQPLGARAAPGSARARSRSTASACRSASGRNSCSGGSSSRIVTGSPSMAREDALEVALLHRQRARRARALASSSSSARIISRTTGRRSSAMNMCSVRQRPMPSAPNSRAARARPPACRRWRARRRRRISSAQPTIGSKSSFDLRRHQRQRARRRPRRCAPSMRDHVALARTSCSPTATVRASTSMLQRLDAGDARLAHAARHDRRVRASCRRARSARPAPRSRRGCRRASSPSARG